MWSLSLDSAPLGRWSKTTCDMCKPWRGALLMWIYYSVLYYVACGLHPLSIVSLPHPSYIKGRECLCILTT
jgi:hypothetical protein